MGNGVEITRQTKPYKLLLRQYQCPGDVLVMSAAVDSLHQKYPGEFLTSVSTTCDDIFKYNPHVRWDLVPGFCHVVEMDYPAIHQAGQRAVHFMGAFCETLEKSIGRPVPLLTNRPHLYLGPEEGPVLDIGPYVVVNSGYKTDFTAKGAGSFVWQEVVDHFSGRVQFVQVGERNPHHHHKPLSGVVDMVGKTTNRELFRLVRYAAGACGPVSYLHHVAAAFQVPYVCLAGGREEPSWESYNTSVYLHTIGQLDCCKQRGCWKSRTVPLGDGDHKDRSLCSLPVMHPNGETAPKCLAMIGAAGVIEALERILEPQLGGR